MSVVYLARGRTRALSAGTRLPRGGSALRELEIGIEAVAFADDATERV
jgi:hypothetical protein